MPDMQWIPVTERLPEIPKGYHSIGVIVAAYDPVYEEIHPGGGYDVYEAMWDGRFIESASGPKGSCWMPIQMEVTHWMPMPDPPRYPRCTCQNENVYDPFCPVHGTQELE